jgi:hypothetical protein
MQNLQLELEKELKYLDSIEKSVFNLGFQFTFNEVSDKQITKVLI